jgi:hypothetical protein
MQFVLDDGSLLLVGESEIASEIETLMASLGSSSQSLKPTKCHPGYYEGEKRRPKPLT